MRNTHRCSTSQLPTIPNSLKELEEEKSFSSHLTSLILTFPPCTVRKVDSKTPLHKIQNSRAEVLEIREEEVCNRVQMAFWIRTHCNISSVALGNFKKYKSYSCYQVHSFSCTVSISIFSVVSCLMKCMTHCFINTLQESSHLLAGISWGPWRLSHGGARLLLLWLPLWTPGHHSCPCLSWGPPVSVMAPTVPSVSTSP